MIEQSDARTQHKKLDLDFSLRFRLRREPHTSHNPIEHFYNRTPENGAHLTIVISSNGFVKYYQVATPGAALHHCSGGMGLAPQVL